MAGHGTSIVLGIDVGGTKIAGAAADLQGRILCRHTVRTAVQSGPEGIVAQIVALAGTLVLACGRKLDDVATIGLGAPGLTGAAEGIVFQAPNLPNWRDVPLKAMVESQLGRPVHLENDARAAAIAEHTWGAGQGVDDMVYVTVSTGVGGGLILNGHLYRGAAGTAGEIGHVAIEANGPPCCCGGRGCLEVLASGTAIARQAVVEIRAGARTIVSDIAGGDLGAVTARTVQEAASRGDELAVRLLTRAGEYLGIGLAGLTNVLAPRLVVVGGGVAAAGELILGPARQTLRERACAHPASVVEVVKTRLGRDTALLGTIALALGYDYPFGRTT